MADLDLDAILAKARAAKEETDWQRWRGDSAASAAAATRDALSPDETIAVIERLRQAETDRDGLLVEIATLRSVLIEANDVQVERLRATEAELADLRRRYETIKTALEIETGKPCRL